MALPLRTSLLPQCTSCTCRLTASAFSDLRPVYGRVQVRGKKKVATNPDTLTVQLQRDVPTFGKKGSYVPVSVGQMRNEWFPRRVANYVTAPALKELKAQNAAMERDYTFKADEIARKGRSGAEEAVDEVAAFRQTLAPQRETRQRQVEVERITPERSVELLEILVPPRLDFLRQAIEPTPAAAEIAATEAEKPMAEQTRDSRQQQRPRRERSTSTAASDLLAARANVPKPLEPARSEVPAGPRQIFGSVSTGDVATAMRQHLAENEEASKIVLGEEDVRFVDVKDEQGRIGESDRVKQTGDYQIEVRIRGAETVVKRNVRVLPR